MPLFKALVQVSMSCIPLSIQFAPDSLLKTGFMESYIQTHDSSGKFPDSVHTESTNFFLFLENLEGSNSVLIVDVFWEFSLDKFDGVELSHPKKNRGKAKAKKIFKFFIDNLNPLGYLYAPKLNRRKYSEWILDSIQTLHNLY